MTDALSIVLVDDDEDLLQLLTLRLQSKKYAVTCATSGEQAIQKIQARLPNLVITDLRMGGMDGMDLFRYIKAQWPTLPVIILTAHGSVPDAVLAMQEGVFSFLTKPVDNKELFNTIERLVSVNGNRLPKPGETMGLITQSQVMLTLIEEARLVAKTDSSVFIFGESGTGKELLANAIHEASPRRDNPFIAVNCSAITEGLFESELFGHKKGAFTGANTDHQGLMRAAEGGTLFLDEIGDMPYAFQTKLLRALQERSVKPVGDTKQYPINIRIISATHKALQPLIDEEAFREDFYYRLNVVQLSLPPLRERKEDIPLLVNQFLKNSASSNRRKNIFLKVHCWRLLIINGRVISGNYKTL